MADTVRTAIADKMKTITGIGQVHEYERYAKDLSGLAEFYGNADGQLRGWFIRRQSVEEIRDGRPLETVRWQIRGYMALSDANQSELQFNDLVDAIRTAFRVDCSLGGKVTTTATDDGNGIQMPEFQQVLFANVLCHAVTLTLTTERYL